MARRVAVAIVAAAAVAAACVVLARGGGYGRWERVSPGGTAPENPSWLPFEWVGDVEDGRRIERVAMTVTVHVEDLPQSFSLQLDTGSDLTMLDGGEIRRLAANSETLRSRLKTDAGQAPSGSSPAHLEGLLLGFGDEVLRGEKVLLRDDPGASADEEAPDDGAPAPLGTLGVDVFQGRILVIDYPRRRFAVCDSVPESLRGNERPIELNGSGKPILPMTLRGKSYRVLFDTGSSRFQLMTTSARMPEFSTAAPVDSVPVWSFGKRHTVVGRPVADAVSLAGESVSSVVVHEDARPEAKELYESDGVDAVAGNALFWDRVVVIDFRRRTFSVK